MTTPSASSVGPSAGPFQCIWFDCDSTLSTIEGIDELGAFRDAETTRAVTELTNAAMAGEIPLEEVYGRRLEILAPSREECESLAGRYVEHLVPDADRVVAALQHLGKSVGVISGGILPAVGPFGRQLGVPAELIHAVELQFDASGQYVGLAGDQPLSRSGGKLEILNGSDLRPRAMIGDGVTDLETSPIVERFVGFGGVARRAKVEAEATFFTAAPSLKAVLPFLLTTSEQERLGEDASFADLLTE